MTSPIRHSAQQNEQELQQKQQPIIQSFQLKGHGGAVLCLDHSSSASSNSSRNSIDADNTGRIGSSYLLSGSEDGTCRLWDLRNGIRATHCIRCCPVGHCEDVLSVTFGPKWITDFEATATTTSHFSKDFSIYATVGSKVFGYDLRNVSSPIITMPSTELSFLEAPDDINQITFSSSVSSHRSKSRSNNKIHHRTGTNNDDSHRINNQNLFATADDCGTVRVTHSYENWEYHTKTNQNQPTKQIYVHGDTSTLITSLAFCPRRNVTKQCLLVSGGTDCSIKLWDVSSCMRSSHQTKSSSLHQPIASITIPQQQGSDSTNQVCNPPLVHCLNWSPSGNFVSAGLGDGSLICMHQSNTSLVVVSRIFDAHSGSVASCFYPAWTNEQSIQNNAITSHDRLLCTAGNDGNIVFWDLGTSIVGDKANNPAELFPSLRFDNTDDVNESMSQLQVSQSRQTIDSTIDEPYALISLRHGAKPNWVVNSGNQDSSFRHTLFVADTSHNITAYTIPIE